MAVYRVFFTPDADAEILKSYEWGVRSWGEDQARPWLRELYATVFRRLRGFPLSCPVAPESNDLDFEARQLIYGRYRILFVVKCDIVQVLYLRGPYIGTANDEWEEELD